MAGTITQISSPLPDFHGTFYPNHLKQKSNFEVFFNWNDVECSDLTSVLKEGTANGLLTDAYNILSQINLNPTRVENLTSTCDIIEDFDNKFLTELSNTNYDEDDDGDNESVMLDINDLSFLDNKDVAIDSDSEHCSSSSKSDDASSQDASDSSESQSRIPDFGFICQSDDSANATEDDSEDDNIIDYVKPYCTSRRGAKNVLLWKYILHVLNVRSDLAKWIDRSEGVFKFVDTAAISRLWGEKKRKGDMTFEKLSRGIRHYYKSGLMSRVEGTRLVYKFNWMQVPKPFRKK